MFLLCLTLILFLSSSICFLRHKVLIKRNKKSDYDCGALIVTVIGCIFLLMSILVSMVSYANQIYDMEELKKLDKYEQLYLSKADVLTKKFASYLLEIYPRHEKDIYNNIKPQDLDLYLVKYPELKASETIILLVDQVRTLQNDYYAQGLLKADTTKKLMFRPKNPWTYCFLIPKYIES